MRDDELVMKVREAILCDRRLSSQHIEVASSKGIVTLTGRVQSHRRKLVAQELASAFKGCREVVNSLEVIPAKVVADDQVAERVRSALDSHADITAETISVAVSGGIATLRGTANSDWERLLAEDVALSGRGVRGVTNLLLVDPQLRSEDLELTRKLAGMLQHLQELAGTEVRITVSGDAVVLSGTVTHLMQKQMAHDIVRRFFPRVIRNEIIVTGGDS